MKKFLILSWHYALQQTISNGGLQENLLPQTDNGIKVGINT